MPFFPPLVINISMILGGDSSILTPENLYCSLDQNNENDLRLNAASSLEIVKGYVFTKKQKTSVKQKKKKGGFNM